MSSARTKAKNKDGDGSASGNIDKAMANLSQQVDELQHRLPIPFDEFLNEVLARPEETTSRRICSSGDNRTNRLDR